MIKIVISDWFHLILCRRLVEIVHWEDGHAEVVKAFDDWTEKKVFIIKLIIISWFC